MAKVTFYHATQNRFKVGDIICGAYPKKNFEWCGSVVFLNTKPEPHFTMVEYMEKYPDTVWYVYEVAPIGKMGLGNWDDLVCDNAQVVRFVGNGRGLLNHFKKKVKKKKSKDYTPSGTRVHEHELASIPGKVNGRINRQKRMVACFNRYYKEKKGK